MGVLKEAPFDRILITVGALAVPPALIEQLDLEGILVAPIGDKWTQDLTIVIKEKGGITVKRGVPCVFVPLIGVGGWTMTPPATEEEP